MRVLIFTFFFLGLTTFAFATQDKKTAKIRVQSATGQLDETTIYFDQGVNPSYFGQEDAQKLFSGNPGVPVIYSVTSDGIYCRINGYSTLTQTEIIPLGVEVDADGQYTIRAMQTDNFDNTSIIRLEDRLNNTFTDLRANFYTATINADDAPTGRFFLHISRATDFTSVASGCDNNDGLITVDQDNSIAWDMCQLTDANNTVINTVTDASGNFNFNSLPAGTYTMAFVYGSYVADKTFQINTHAISASINASTVEAYTGQDIDFHALAANATHFNWTFGDGTEIVGIANPTLSFYEAGTFSVNLKCSNDFGCQSDANFQVNIDQALTSGINDINGKNISVSAFNNTITVNMNDDVRNGAMLNVYNLIGQSIYSTPVNDAVTTVTINNQPAGYYVVSVKNGDKAGTKKVFLGNK